jgi:hypothetical protein
MSKKNKKDIYGLNSESASPSVGGSDLLTKQDTGDNIKLLNENNNF